MLLLLLISAGGYVVVRYAIPDTPKKIMTLNYMAMKTTDKIMCKEKTVSITQGMGAKIKTTTETDSISDKKGNSYSRLASYNGEMKIISMQEYNVKQKSGVLCYYKDSILKKWYITDENPQLDTSTVLYNTFKKNFLDGTITDSISCIDTGSFYQITVPMRVIVDLLVYSDLDDEQYRIFSKYGNQIGKGKIIYIIDKKTYRTHEIKIAGVSWKQEGINYRVSLDSLYSCEDDKAFSIEIPENVSNKAKFLSFEEWNDKIEDIYEEQQNQNKGAITL